MTLSYTEQLVTEKCCQCSIAFAMPKDFNERRLKDHGRFFCPAGHSQQYTGKTEEQKLREQLQAKEAELAREVTRHDQTKSALTGTMQQLGKARAEKERIARRVTNGVCPCCNRTFANLARHMKTKHPSEVK